jgi:DNA glycosylase AlkZ-like
MIPGQIRLIRRRLGNQRLVRGTFRTPADVVCWFGAVQSQDFSGAKWAVGQRLAGGTDEIVEQAFNVGKILRTHVMRPTWHFVTPADIRWLLALTGPRVLAFSAYYFRKNGLDARRVAKSHAAMERALAGGRHLTRAELGEAIRKAGIDHYGERLGNIMMHAELHAVICSGPRRGKQFTYALLEERVPPARALDRDEALAELTSRYFTSHGPATARDFAWWSGLTMRDVKNGLEMISKSLEQETIGGLVYWFVPTRVSPPPTPSTPLVHLLPNYDECLIAYKDRETVPAWPTPPNIARHGSFAHHLVIDGRIAGAWRRRVGTKQVEIDVLPYRPLTRAESRALDAMIDQHSQFMNLPVRLVTI